MRLWEVGLILLSLSMFGSLLFGVYHDFLVASPDHVRLPISANDFSCGEHLLHLLYSANACVFLLGVRIPDDELLLMGER